jgi:hypothetical protein
MLMKNVLHAYSLSLFADAGSTPVGLGSLGGDSISGPTGLAFGSAGFDNDSTVAGAVGSGVIAGAAKPLSSGTFSDAGEDISGGRSAPAGLFSASP